MNDVERFWSKVDRRGDDECWPWLGTKFAIDGRGRVTWRHRTTSAPRVAWEIATGEAVPSGIFACHHCDNPSCVNPKHLFLGTARDNSLDMWRKGRHKPLPVMKGIDNYKATISADVLQEAIEYYWSHDESQVAVADRFSIGRSAFATWLHGRFRSDERPAALPLGGKGLKPCGTRAAYLRHLKAGEHPCPECAEAARIHERGRVDRRRIARQAKRAAA